MCTTHPLILYIDFSYNLMSNWQYRKYFLQREEKQNTYENAILLVITTYEQINYV